MAKKSRKRARSSGRAESTVSPRALRERLEQAITLLEDEEKLEESLSLLQELDQRYQNNRFVLEALVNAYARLGNPAGYLGAIRRLYRLTPNNPDVAWGLANAYLVNDHVALAYHQFQVCLERWPHHTKAEEARKMLPKIEEYLGELIGPAGMTLEEDLELITLHEEIQISLHERDPARLRQLAERAHKLKPEFAPPLNNLSLCYWLEGNLPQAIATARKVLAIHPQNTHALSNLIRFLYLAGQEDEARALLLQLREASVHAPEAWTKKLEALSILGEDQEVIETSRLALNSGEEISEPVFYGLLAAAEARQGDIEAAIRHWEQALELDPEFHVAHENLENIQKESGERLTPWAEPFHIWINENIVRRIVQRLESLAHRSAGIREAVLQRFLDKEHPEILRLAAPILARGDPQAKEFIRLLADASGHPALLDALKEYTFGKADSLSARMQAVQVLVERGLLPSGEVNLWMDGEWKPLLFLNYQITSEPVEDFPLKPEARPLMKRAIDEMNARDGTRAEQLLRTALEIQPDHPGLLNNLAYALALQGKDDEASSIVQYVAEHFPDYFIGQMSVARQAIVDEDLEKAHDILVHWMREKKVFHVTEFGILCIAQIELAMAKGNTEVARYWLDFWEEVNPDDTKLPAYRKWVQKFRRGHLRPGSPMR